VQVVFFPVSLMSLASMAAMLLIYLCLTLFVEPADEPYEDYIQPPAAPLAMPAEFPSPDRNLPMERPSGGIVIEK
jgi:hypothetical protein